MKITEEEAKALADWANGVTTIWGAKFDAALAVAQRVARSLKTKKKKKKPKPPRGKAPKPGWR